MVEVHPEVSRKNAPNPGEEFESTHPLRRRKTPNPVCLWEC